MLRKQWNADKWLLTTQPEHARVAGSIAAAWKMPGKKVAPEVLQAISRHDDGWRTEDATPRITRTGEPMTFDKIDAPSALRIWRESSAALLAENKPYAAALVAGHFVYHAKNNVLLARLRPRDAAEVGKFIVEQSQLMRPYLPQTNASADANDAATTYPHDLRFLQVCDLLSILLLSDFVGDFEIPDVPYLADGNTLRVNASGVKLILKLDPLPFRKGLRETISACIIPRRQYADDEDLRRTLSESKQVSVEIHVGS